MISFLKKIFSRKLLVVVHDGTFHADDVCATAVLMTWLDKNNKNYKIIRTTDPTLIEKADIVYDTGGIYDPARMMFDHHQKGGAGKRENGISYSSLGLIWKHCGAELCGRDENIAREIDVELVQHIDAFDNGQEQYPLEYFLQLDLPTWKEDSSTVDSIFFREVSVARKAFSRILKRKFDEKEARMLFQELYFNAKDRRVIEVVQPFSRTEIQQYLKPELFPELLYVIFRGRDIKDGYRVISLAKNSNTFEGRKHFPEAWRGLMDEKLEQVTGIKGAKFCHLSGFMLKGTTREAAVKLAEKALAM